MPFTPSEASVFLFIHLQPNQLIFLHMALISLTGGFGEIKGKQGATIYQGSKYGQMVRTNRTGRKRTSNFFQAAKGKFSQITTIWRTLLQSEREEWAAVALTITWTNKFGINYNPSGFALFVSTNNNLFSFNGTYNKLPPVNDLGALINFIDFLPIYNSSMGLGLDGICDTPDNLEIFASRPYGAGQNPTSPSYRFIVKGSYTGSTNIDIITPYNASYGLAPVGSVVFVKIRGIGTATGWTTPWYYKAGRVSAP